MLLFKALLFVIKYLDMSNINENIISSIYEKVEDRDLFLKAINGVLLELLVALNVEEKKEIYQRIIRNLPIAIQLIYLKINLEEAICQNQQE